MKRYKNFITENANNDHKGEKIVIDSDVLFYIVIDKNTVNGGWVFNGKKAEIGTVVGRNKLIQNYYDFTFDETYIDGDPEDQIYSIKKEDLKLLKIVKDKDKDKKYLEILSVKIQKELMDLEVEEVKFSGNVDLGEDEMILNADFSFRLNESGLEEDLVDRLVKIKDKLVPFGFLKMFRYPKTRSGYYLFKINLKKLKGSNFGKSLFGISKFDL